MMSVQGEADYLRRSMLAGAREFLVKPFSSDELVVVDPPGARPREGQGDPPGRTAGRRRPASTGREPGRIVTVFSPKGGVGRTTVAVNLAVVAASEMGKKVALVDASFQFGDVGVLLNLNPKNKSIADLIPDMAEGDPEMIDQVLVTHSSGLRVMLAPPSPEMSELITTAFLRRVLERLRDTHDLVIVDSWPWFHDTTLGLLDLSDEILALLTLEITNIKNIRLFLEVADQLGYPAGKIKLVLNRADSALGIRVSDVEHSIGRRIDETIVSDGRSVVYALNRGVPFVTSNREAQVSQDIIRLARSVIGEAVRPAAQREKPVQRKSLFAWR